jgi:CspA family cold shock protein
LLYYYQEMSTSNVSTSSERFTGRVKWFNNKAGYGFITVTDGDKSGTDVFVHHSSIKVDDEQYKYLVQGEYVNFNLLDTMTDRHEFQAGDVCGIKGGKLMCETRHESRVARFQYRSTKTDEQDSAVRMPRQVSAPKEYSDKRSPTTKSQNLDKEWTHVSRTRDVGSGPTSGSGRGSKGSTGRGSGTGGRGGSTGRGRGRPPKVEQPPKLERSQSTAEY